MDKSNGVRTGDGLVAGNLGRVRDGRRGRGRERDGSWGKDGSSGAEPEAVCPVPVVVLRCCAVTGSI